MYYRQENVRPMAVDRGPNPFVANINNIALSNNNFRTTVWTGQHLQLTVMNIPIQGDVGLEVHNDVDQILYIVDGEGITQMGDTREHLYLTQRVSNGTMIFVPAGTWHNVVNMGNRPLRLYTTYAPPEHPWGTIHQTQEIAQEMEQQTT